MTRENVFVLSPADKFCSRDPMTEMRPIGDYVLYFVGTYTVIIRRISNEPALNNNGTPGRARPPTTDHSSFN